MIYDQEHLEIGAKYSWELHTIFATLIRLAVKRVENPRQIVISPAALTLLHNGNHSIYQFDIHPRTSLTSSVVGFIDNVKVILNQDLEEHEPVRIEGDTVEFVEVKNFSFI